MYIVLYCENVMSLRLFERVCWLPYFKKCKLYIQVLGTVYTGFGNCIYRFWELYIQVLGYVLYAAVMLLKFYKITNLEKKIFYTSFQQATRLRFTGFSSRWK